jgi:Zn-dependent protease
MKFDIDRDEKQRHDIHQNSEPTYKMPDDPETHYDTRDASRKRTARGKFGGMAAAAMLVLGKFKGLLAGLYFLLKGSFIFLKFGKFAGTLISMILMVVVYMQSFGLPFALGFVLLILAHEMGHFFAAKRENLDVSAPMFIPFVGALISMKEMPKSVGTEARIALGGPITGAIASLCVYALYLMTGVQIFEALAYTGCILNLFNLIPIHPLDGGRITGAISPMLWLVGIPLGIYALFITMSPILFIILILGAMQAYRQWRNPDKSYYEVSASERAAYASLYFGLLFMLGTGIAVIHG